MRKTIVFSDNPLNGIVQYLQNQTTEDIISAKFAQIFVPSIREEIKGIEPSIIFGINNQDYSQYWSTNNYEENKYVIFTFKYPILITGIGIYTGSINWFTSYSVSISDNLIWECEYEFQAGELLAKPYYFGVSGMKPSKMIKLIPKGSSSFDGDNFAIYGIDFFGTIFFTPKFTCNCQLRMYSFSFMFVSLTIC